MSRLKTLGLSAAFLASVGDGIGGETRSDRFRIASPVLLDQGHLHSVSVPIHDWHVNAWGNPVPQHRLWRGLDGTNFIVASLSAANAKLVSSLTIQSGVEYEVRVRAVVLRSTVAVVSFRRDAPPWQTFGQHTLKLPPGESLIVVKGVGSPETTGSGSIRIGLPAGGAIRVKDATLRSYKRSVYDAGAEREEPAAAAFGIVINKLTSPPHWPPLPIDVLRLWDTGTTWLDLAGTPRGEKYGRLDRYVNLARSHRSEVLLTLGQTPASSAEQLPGDCVYDDGCSPPKLQEWRLYVRELASRYAHRIKYWELWNEPDSRQFWAGTASQMATLAKVAHEEIKRYNPQAQLIGPSVTRGGIDFLDEFLFAGGGTYIDGLSFHSYYASEQSLLSDVENIKYVLVRHGLQRLPLWNTEGAAAKSDSDDCQSMSGDNAEVSSVDVKAMLLMRASGVQHFSYYNWERADALGRRLYRENDYGASSAEGDLLARIAKLQRTMAVKGAIVTEKSTTIIATIGTQLRAISWSKGARPRVLRMETDIPIYNSANQVASLVGATHRPNCNTISMSKVQ